MDIYKNIYIFKPLNILCKPFYIHKNIYIKNLLFCNENSDKSKLLFLKNHEKLSNKIMNTPEIYLREKTYFKKP